MQAKVQRSVSEHLRRIAVWKYLWLIKEPVGNGGNMVVQKRSVVSLDYR